MLQAKISLIPHMFHFEINRKVYEWGAEEERWISVLFHFICHSDTVIFLCKKNYLVFDNLSALHN